MSNNNSKCDIPIREELKDDVTVIESYNEINSNDETKYETKEEATVANNDVNHHGENIDAPLRTDLSGNMGNIYYILLYKFNNLAVWLH